MNTAKVERKREIVFFFNAKMLLFYTIILRAELSVCSNLYLSLFSLTSNVTMNWISCDKNLPVDRSCDAFSPRNISSAILTDFSAFSFLLLFSTSENSAPIESQRRPSYRRTYLPRLHWGSGSPAAHLRISNCTLRFTPSRGANKRGLRGQAPSMQDG